MTDRNPDRYDNQEQADEKIRRQTLRFEAHFIKTANRVRWQVHPYMRGETNENLSDRPLRD